LLRVRSETGMRDRNGGSRFPACIPASGPTFCELGTVLSKGQRDADDAAKHWPFARWAAVLCVFVLAVGSGAQARELSTMDGDEIKGLQQRLTDASCYAGPLDGTASNMLAAAKAACPDQEPVLRIETGMHVAPIWQISVDARCDLAATGSDDKTVRLWSLPDGRLMRVLLPPIGTGISGKVDSVAISPDGRYVAVGGRDAHADIDKKIAVSIFDASSGASCSIFGRRPAPRTLACCSYPATASPTRS
jgi:hypothetical protein